MLEDVERQKTQVDRELHDKWQGVLGKIDVFPQGIEEQLQLQQSIFQLQQSIFMQEISTIISELAVLRQDKEQLQLQQSVFMQEISAIISELTVLRQDKEQLEREQTAEDVLPLAIKEQLEKEKTAAEVRQLMDEMKAHMLEDVERQKKQEERESQLTKELYDKWQDVLGRVNTFPQTIEEQLQLQQDKEQREREETAAEVRQLMDEMKTHMLEDVERQKKQEERESQLTKELHDKWQDVLGRVDAFPQAIEEQLQLQQNVFMQEVSKIISELAVLQQDKEQWERKEKAGNNMEWNVVEEVRHLKDEMGTIQHMLEEVAGYSRRLTEILQQKDIIIGEISLLKVELAALRKAQEQANEQIEQQHSFEESAVCPQMIEAQLKQQGNMLNQEILSLKEELGFIRELHENKLKRKKQHH